MPRAHRLERPLEDFIEVIFQDAFRELVVEDPEYALQAIGKEALGVTANYAGSS